MEACSTLTHCLAVPDASTAVIAKAMAKNLPTNYGLKACASDEDLRFTAVLLAKVMKRLAFSLSEARSHCVVENQVKFLSECFVSLADDDLKLESGLPLIDYAQHFTIQNGLGYSSFRFSIEVKSS
jgi:hypothetical protein